MQNWETAAVKPPSGRGATAAQVARAAGVSRTTVSFVLNGLRDKGISATTWDRVLQAAQVLRYQPHAAAQSLASGSTGTVGLIVADSSHLYYDAFLAQLAASVNDECHARGLRLLIESAQHDNTQDSGFVRLVRARRIDGLIVINPRRAAIGHLRRLAEARIPMVVLGSGIPELDSFHTLGSDTRSSAALPMQHLLALGHRRIGYVNFIGGDYFAGREREAGWRASLCQAGIDPHADWVEAADISAASGEQAARRLLARELGLSAIFAGNDTIAFGVMHALRTCGRRIPQDVAVVGYDDTPLAAFAQPPLTTVRTDPVAHGRESVALLAQLLEREPCARQHHLTPAQLIVRASCGAPVGRNRPGSN